MQNLRAKKPKKLGCTKKPSTSKLEEFFLNLLYSLRKVVDKKALNKIA